ncbi:LysR family transcriptional regulator [Sulfurovum sp.]|uniref:LysR family transcriptional regulator n=1 Tax=Sulfurovum sp. TaxID=1969726 RepID=UPI00180D261B|nr:LysR family transcriptional regulator [Sulfurovum sp.]HFU77163.1 LysR family transcriptional regulator [Campylobacterota bacterium]
MVNIELYRIFIAIYRAGTISKAAVLCDITQPAASHQLASLEKKLKVKLFERTPRAMVPTNEGHELYTKVADSFDWLDFVSQDFVMQREEEPLLRVGVPLAFYTKKLIQKVKYLPFRLDIHFDSHGDLYHDLLENKLDILIGEKLLTSTKIYSKPLERQAYWLVGHHHVSTPEKDFSSWHNIRGWVQKQNWLSYDAELSTIRTCFKSQYDLQPNIKPKYILPDIHAMLLSVQSIKSVCILPDYFCKEAIEKHKIKCLHKFDAISNNMLYLSYDAHAKNNILIKKFCELVDEV